MQGLFHHMLLTLRLNFRSKQAIVYGYIFPIIFLLAFWGIYSKESPPLASELGQLLTVTILSGACFGMPTAMVGERERGIWRRYVLLPSATGGIVISSMIARCVIVSLAVVMQVCLAHWVCKTPWPAHPWQLAGTFFFVAFAFLGMGLVIAMLADNVPAVQALGQAIFLPMLMIGGIGVPLRQLPEWARHVAAFMPGLYAVDAMDVAIRPHPLSSAVPLLFCLGALVVIGVAGCLAGRQLFRWDAGQKLRLPPPARVWVTAALAGWLAVGLFAEQTGKIKSRKTSLVASMDRPTTAPATAPTITPTTQPLAATEPATQPLMAKLAPWTAITDDDIAKITYDDLPPDAGTVTPVSKDLDSLDDDGKKWLEGFQSKLDQWDPGKEQNLAQRVRNLLSIAAVADILQDQHEGDIPLVIFDHLRFDLPEEKLKKILGYIAYHPETGTVITKIPEFGIEGEVGSEEEIRGRVEAYGRKLLGRLLGRLPPK